MLAAIEASLREGRLGLRSRIAEDLDGEPILRRTAARLLAVSGIEEVSIVGRPDEAEALGRLVEGLPVRFFPSDAGDITSRGRLRRGRAWALGSWRGGLGHSYFVCEAGRPASLLELCRARKRDHVLVAPAAAPLLAPELAGELVAAFRREGSGKRLCLATSPPGLSADIFSADLLDLLAAANRSVDGVLDFRPDDPDHQVDGLGMFHWYPNRITQLRARLCADTDGSLRRVRAIVERLGPLWHEVPAERIIELLGADPRLLAGDFPQEILLEVTTRRNLDGVADALPAGAADMAPEVLEAVLEETSRRDDVRLTIGIHGEPFCHPRITEILERIAASRPFALHLHTDALGLTEPILEALAAAQPTVISVKLDAATAPTYQRLHGSDAFDRAVANTRGLARLQTDAGRFLVPEFAVCEENASEVEAFYDTWYTETGWVTVSDHDDCAGRRPRLRPRDHLPPERTFCAHLTEELVVVPDGAITLCRQDLWEPAALGRIGRDDLASVWAARPLDSEHCGRCRTWSF